MHMHVHMKKEQYVSGCSRNNMWRCDTYCSVSPYGKIAGKYKYSDHVSYLMYVCNLLASLQEW